MGILGPTPNRKQRRRLNRLTEQVMRPSFIRWPLMLALVVIMINVYWWHFGNKLAEIEARTSFLDQTGSWSKADRDKLARRAAAFRSQWGMHVLVHVKHEPVEVPELKSTTVFIGLAPAREDVLIILPPLAAQALRLASKQQGQDMRLTMERNLLMCARERPNTAPCLLQTLDALSSVLTHGTL